MSASRARSPRRRFRWSKEARDLVAANRQAKGLELSQVITQVSELTGYPRDACYRFARMMGLRSKKPYRRWSHEESERLLQLFELHPLGTTARKLNLSTSSVESMLIRLGVTAQMYKDSFTKHLLASLLHIRPAVVQKWIDTGMLKARREGTTTLPRMIIEAEDFTRFCKTHPEAILRGHVRQDRLEFVFKFVFPAATWIYCR